MIKTIRNFAIKSNKSKYAIEVNNLSKTFYLPKRRFTTFSEFVSNPWLYLKHHRFDVLKGVSFKVKKGETLGIIGPNGAGKSTLLKILAGIYVPDKGTVKFHGKMVPFLELGVGFHPDLTARENIFLNGLILGMSRSFLKRNLNKIIEFAELQEFIDVPLKNFSSGMQVRLAFSIAFLSDADIYLLDEVFSVGDAHFQQKSKKVFDDLKAQGKTLLIVSHSLELMQSYADRVLWLEKGKISAIGKPDNVLKKYNEKYK